MIKLSCKKLSHSDTSLPIIKNRLSPPIWKMPWKVYLKLPIMGFCDSLNLQWNSGLPVPQAKRELSHIGSLQRAIISKAIVLLGCRRI